MLNQYRTVLTILKVNNMRCTDPPPTLSSILLFLTFFWHFERRKNLKCDRYQDFFFGQFHLLRWIFLVLYRPKVLLGQHNLTERDFLLLLWQMAGDQKPMNWFHEISHAKKVLLVSLPRLYSSSVFKIHESWHALNNARDDWPTSAFFTAIKTSIDVIEETHLRINKPRRSTFRGLVISEEGLIAGSSSLFRCPVAANYSSQPKGRFSFFTNAC